MDPLSANRLHLTPSKAADPGLIAHFNELQRAAANPETAARYWKSLNDRGDGIAVDASGNVYVVGRTDSLNFPTTQGALASTYRGGDFDAVVVKLNPQGNGLVYSTYFGGKGTESGASISVDSEGNAYVTGNTSSMEMPVPRGFQRANSSGPTFKSTSAGQDWGSINAGLASYFVWDLVVDASNPSTLYAATPDGMYGMNENRRSSAPTPSGPANPGDQSSFTKLPP